MKKILVLILVLLLLAGCKTSLSTGEMFSAVEKAVSLTVPDPRFNNAKKDYYSYYIPRGVGREERDATSNLFQIYGNEAILNLDIASIIQLQYYDIEANSSVKLRDIGSFQYTNFKKEGTCKDSSNKTINYKILVSAIDQDRNYIIIQTDSFVFASVCPILETDEMIYEMMKILRTCIVNNERIISDYSNVIVEQKKFSIVSLFKDVLPESGYVVDYIEDWKSDERFIIIEYEGEGEDEPAPSTEDHNDELGEEMTNNSDTDSEVDPSEQSFD